jgi:hypothetical protein
MRMRGFPAAVLAATLVLPAGCGGAATGVTTTAAAVTSQAPVEPGRPLRGFALSPPAGDPAGFAAFFDLAVGHADVVERVGDVLEWEEAAGSAMAVVQSLSGTHGYEPITLAGTFDPATGEAIRPLDDATFDRYVAAAADFARRHRPQHLGLGVEVDALWRTDPEEFDRFVELFAAVADAVHDASPDTRVFTTFQLERLSGMQGGLFGGTNDPDQAAWSLIDRFPGADLIGFTTYPGLVYPTPDDIPGDYYERLAGRVGGRPIAFSEMGWQAAGDLGAYSGSPEAQARFVARFPELIADIDVAFYVWSFLFDPGAPAPFDTMGLIAADGTRRPAWEVWAAG